MADALPDESNSRSLPRPDGIVLVKIDPETGLRTNPADTHGIFEIFREDHVPALSSFDQDIDDANISQEIF